MMSAINTQDTVGQLVAERPVRGKIFEKLGIDYCCGGKRPLSEACAEKSLDVEAVVRELREAEAGQAAEETDWTTAPLGAFCDHIVGTHHAYLNEALPRLSFLTNKVNQAHGARHPELAELEDVFAELRAELEAHAMKEEMILFPLIKQLEAAETRPAFHCGSVNNPIRVMEIEHDHAGDALARMRALTGGFTVPEDGCNTYRVMIDALIELEADLHMHIHKENHILFPRAAALEASLKG
jgi:regulator of cell morphogenesis and NO signaling